ncbi:MAG: hypothetical protein P3W87_002490 [Gammaproteobacteria bacterium]|nr:hypothetical protein [Gammaproteobacteria bacterium]
MFHEAYAVRAVAGDGPDAAPGVIEVSETLPSGLEGECVLLPRAN